MLIKKVAGFIVLVCLIATASLISFAQEPDDARSPSGSTSKILSTNFTVINFGTEQAHVTASYLLPDGSVWNDAGNNNIEFTVNPNGGQAIFRQYDSAQFSDLIDGVGSVVISSDQQLVSVVQIQAISQTPSSGAYSAVQTGSSTVYVPLVSRNGVSADGTANSQLSIQNASTGPIRINVLFIDYFSGQAIYTKTNVGIPTGSSFFYDIESESNLPDGFFGSAVVKSVDAGGTGSFVANGTVAVVSNFYLGDDQLQTFNGFPQESVGTRWVAPLVTARLTNGLSTPIAVQNLSGHTLNPGDIQLDCIPNPDSLIQQTLVITSEWSVVDNGTIAFNPVDVNNFAYDNFPTGWYGSCRITATDDVVAFVQMRFVGSGNAAAYEAMPANTSDTTAVVPLIAKRLTNGFATALTVQNLSNTDPATVTLTYIPSPDYVAGGGSTDTIVVTGTIQPGGSFIQNHRIVGGAGSVPELVEAWYGTVLVESSGPPIQAFVQLTNINAIIGDTFMAHNSFSAN